MKKDIFRKSALDRISSLDQLDSTMTVVKAPNILVLATMGIIVVAALVWSIVGSIPQKVAGTGVITNTDQIISVKSANNGSLKNIFVERGDMVKSGQIIARIERQDLLDQITIASNKLDQITKARDEILIGSRNGAKSQQQMRNLYEMGLITEAEYANSRQGEINFTQQISEAKSQLNVLIENYQTATKVVSNSSGVILEIPVAKGDFIQAGQTIAVIGPEEDSFAGKAVIFFPGTDGKKVKAGMKIGIVPSTVKQEEYGFIQGIITSVSEYPVSDSYMASNLQNTTLARYFAQIPNPIEVTVSIIPDPTTYTGYKWSSSRGPNEKIEAGYLCQASVTVSDKRPISLVIPMLKKKLLGVGDEKDVIVQRKQS